MTYKTETEKIIDKEIERIKAEMRDGAQISTIDALKSIIKTLYRRAYDADMAGEYELDQYLYCLHDMGYAVMTIEKLEKPEEATK